MPQPRDRFHVALGQVIRQLRHARGWSQEQLGERVGLHRTYVSVLELGQKSPTVTVLRALAKALGRPAYELMKAADEIVSRGR